MRDSQPVCVVERDSCDIEETPDLATLFVGLLVSLGFLPLDNAYVLNRRSWEGALVERSLATYIECARPELRRADTLCAVLAHEVAVACVVHGFECPSALALPAVLVVHTSEWVAARPFGARS
jgi:hypothetical protein